MTIEFSVDHDHTYAGEDGIEQLIGWITFSVGTYPGDFRVREQGSGTPRTINLPPRRGWLAADGHLYKDQTLAQPFRLVANDPAFNLLHLTYRADFDLTTILGDPVLVPHCYFPAPGTDTTLQLTKVMTNPSQPVMEVRAKGYIEDIIDVSGVGGELVTAPSVSAARSSLGIGTGIYDPVNVKHYGALGNGVHDDTMAIEAAWVASGDAHNIYFPAGNYLYNGTGLDADSYDDHGALLIAKGAGIRSATITLGASSYLFNTASQINQLVLEDMWIEGGKGAIKHTNTGVNSGAFFSVSRVYFHDYTECAIATDSADMPYWYITDCKFQAASATATIGIAMAPGLTDGCNISKCEFTRNRVHIKLGSGGNNMHIRENAFFQYDTDVTGGGRIDVWVVPCASSNNAGNGFTIDSNKFSGENFVTGDYRFVYADEGSGATNGVRLPNLGADSTGYVLGHTYTGNLFRHDSPVTPAPLIYSTTPNVWNLAVRDTQLWNLYPAYVIQFRTVPGLNALSYASQNNVFGPFYGIDNTQVGLPISNDPGIGFTDDPSELLQTRPGAVRRNGSGSSPSFVERLTTAITAFSPTNATVTGTTDAYGGTDAATLNITSGGGYALASVSAFVVGLPCWVEIDVAQPADTPIDGVRLFINGSDASGAAHWIRRVEVPSATLGWVTYAFSFTPRITGSSMYLIIQGLDGSSTGKVKLGRPRIYQSGERILGGRRSSVASGATDLLTTRQLTNDVRNKLIASGVVSGTPYTDPGTPVVGSVFNDANGNKILNLSPVASAVNSLMITNASTGNGVNLYAESAIDSNIDIALVPKGSGLVKINGGYPVADTGTAQTFTAKTLSGVTMADGTNVALNTTTGSKIGTGATQKLGFWNATPIAQPATGGAASTFTANAGTAVNDASTFDGYTIGQVVKALRNAGLLA